MVTVSESGASGGFGAFRRWSGLCFVASLGASIVAAAPRQPPELSSAEREQRALLQPLRDAATDAASLQPLLDWIDQRVAAGEAREAERELRRVLGRMHDEFEQDLQQGMNFLRVLIRQRAVLYTEVSNEEVRLERGRERYDEFLPVPREQDVVPSLMPLPENLLRDIAPGETITNTDPAPTLVPENAATAAQDDEPGDLDMRGLMDRLTADRTALSQLMITCQSESEKERKRHKYALEALAALFKARRAAAQTPPAG